MLIDINAIPTRYAGAMTFCFEGTPWERQVWNRAAKGWVEKWPSAFSYRLLDRVLLSAGFA